VNQLISIHVSRGCQPEPMPASDSPGYRLSWKK
jgi:hypothetical protein